MNKAIIFDRDGVINAEIGDYVWRPADFVIYPATIELMILAQKEGFVIIIITNQGGIAKDLYTPNEVKNLYQIICHKVESGGGKIDDFFFCSHHPSISKCLCRKPETLFFERAIYKHKIQPEVSYMIGDREKDLIPAKKLNMNTIAIGNSSIPCADYFFSNTEELLSFFKRSIFDIPVGE